MLINLHELAGFQRELLLNIRLSKNDFQIHPITLTQQPLIQNFREQSQLLLPYFYVISNTSNKAGCSNRLQRDLIVF